MAYEPEQRYARDRAHKLEIDKPFDEQPPSDRGQFWNVSRSVTGAATGAGLVAGWWFGITDPFDMESIVNDIVGADWFAKLCILGGGIVGFVGALLRRRGLIT